MTNSELASLVDRLRYKKARFSWCLLHDSFVIRVEVMSPDVYTAQVGPVMTEIYINAEQTDLRYFKDLIYRTIVQLETHEVQEWLTLDGTQIVNPHPRTQKECNHVPAYEILDNMERGKRNELPRNYFDNGAEMDMFAVSSHSPAADYSTAQAIGARKRS